MYSNRFRAIGAAVFGAIFGILGLAGLLNGNVGIAVLFGGIGAFLLWSAYQHGKPFQPALAEKFQAAAANATHGPNTWPSQANQEQGDIERARLRKELSDSIASQDSLMMTDIAKVLHKMPGGSSVVALRKYRGTVLAGTVVLHGNIGMTLEMLRKGLLNPEGSPGSWRLIPEGKLNILQQFVDPPEAALAFFVLTPSGQCSMAFSHLVRSDGQVQWISDVGFVCRVAEVLAEVELLDGDAKPPLA